MRDLRENLIVPVIDMGNDLMQKLRAAEFPSRLGELLRNNLFEQNVLADDMIKSNILQSRIEPAPTLSRKFGYPLPSFINTLNVTRAINTRKQ